VHASGALGERDVHPVIDQDARGSSVAGLRLCSSLQSFAGEQSTISSRKIFLPNLNPVDTGSGGGSYLQQEGFVRFARFGCG
jgi:hypothetical protein